MMVDEADEQGVSLTVRRWVALIFGGTEVSAGKPPSKREVPHDSYKQPAGGNH